MSKPIYINLFGLCTFRFDTLRLIFQVTTLSMQFEFITDHKPLEVIYSPKSKPPLRIEKWALRFQLFNYKVKHRPGKYNVADAWFRLPLTSTPKVNIVEEYIHFITRNVTQVA